MLGAKSVPNKLKHIQCKCGFTGKNSPVHYVPKQYPIQDVLNTKMMTAYFKLMLPEMGSALYLGTWASGTPDHNLLHMCRALCVIKQMGLLMNFKERFEV